MLPKKLIVITGPTASGKTKTAIELAKHFNTEIISADSRQFFREMNIGTAKPSAEDLKEAKHHFIGHISVNDNYDSGKYESDAIALIEKLFEKQNILILVGGSGLYIDAVCNGFDALPDVDEKIREELNLLHKEKGIAALHELLHKHDPEHYNNVDLNNPHRVIRALEICIGTGLPYSSFRKGKGKKRNFDIIKIGLNIERQKLYARINSRVEEMMNVGLLEEVKSLLPLKHLNALQTVGYKELFEHLENKIDLQTAIEKIKQNTRNFAKRQMTWFRKDENTKWLPPENTSGIIYFIKE